MTRNLTYMLLGLCRTMYIRNAILIYFFLLLQGVVEGQTNVSGGIYSSETWTKANSPYIVTGNLVLFNDYTLTIEPGVTVQINDNIGFECRGWLKAIGTAADSITFTSNSPAPTKAIWKGITVIHTVHDGQPEQVHMEYCKAMYANVFVDLDIAYQGPYLFNHCYFFNNTKVNNDGGEPGTYFNYCRFEQNTSALNYIQFQGRVSHSEFIGNDIGVNGYPAVDTCVFFNNNTALIPYGSAKGNRVYGNNIGASCVFNGVNNNFADNLIYNNNIGLEMFSFFNGVINFKNNSICNNTLYNIKNSGTNDADLSGNCWCSDDSLFIRSKIYDGYTDPSVGLVSFSPSITNCNSTLPVRLLNFSCYASGSTVFLNWASAEESDLQKYIVQCSTDGIDFWDEATINPKGSNSTYSFTHQPVSGQIFYRLKIIERNGNTKYSAVRFIKFENKNVSVTIAPNPANGVITITGKRAVAIRSVEIISLDGRKSKYVNNYLDGQAINISGLPGGTYFIKTTFRDEQVDYSRFIKR